MSLASRDANLERLESQQFDLVIIGGGITGACLAYDASTRGLKTAVGLDAGLRNTYKWYKQEGYL